MRPLSSLIGLLSAAVALPYAPPELPDRAGAGEQVVSALTPISDESLRFDFVRERQRDGTRLVRAGSAPELYKDPPSTEAARLVHYPAGVGALKAWVIKPEREALRASAGYPVLLYLHDGWAVSAEDLARAQLFAQAGLFVVLPSWRGENGNPGQYELLFGELDDLVDSVRYSAALPEADPARMAVFGHGLGGMLSALSALVADLPVVETASSAGLHPDSAFEHLNPPFADAANERRSRLMGPHVEHLRLPHLACVGSNDEEVFQIANQLAARAQAFHAPLTMLTEPGTRASSRSACEARYRKRLVQLFAPPLNP